MSSISKKRFRTPKNPTQPKHPSSAFLFYLRDTRPKYMAQHPTKSLGYISKLISKDWKELSDEEKAIYIQKSEEDKKRYSIEMKMWTEARAKESMNSNSF
ncbi:hypothetical protein PIROE2DRAFT_49237 [Piromyces sp. E2]|nr:hypothetical protein PIROE2DRAFT_49237 [Piromyces sp. E2]|eukprot:OUM56795.1 hypothetical protein PIROE2DRAFT_49237 [Piromyces sp. E2]